MLLRSLRIGFRAPDLICFAVLGNLYLRQNTIAAVMGRLYPRNARVAEGIRELILSDDVSDSIDDGTEFDENYVKTTEGDPACAVDARSDDYSCNEMDDTDCSFQWRRQGRSG